MSSPTQSSHYRADIDGLRAIAVVSVLLHHAFPNWNHSGFIGVDIFFVISGYLISSIILSGLQKEKFSFVDFYAKRVKRIFPALFLVLLATFLMGWFTLTPNDLKQLGKHIAAGSAFVSNFAFWQEAGYFDAASANKPLLHLWSLAIEEQFYLFWPLAMWALHRWRAQAMRWIAVLFALSFVFSLYVVKSPASPDFGLLQTGPTSAFYNPLSRFWELMIGSLLAAWHLKLSQTQSDSSSFLQRFAPQNITTTRANWLAGFGVLLLAVVLWRISPQRTFPGFWALLPTLGTAALIAAGPKAWVNRYILSSKPFVWIGLISYPLYLWHWPLLAFAHIDAGQLPPWTTQALWLGVSVVLATLTYHMIEKPIRFGRLNRRATTIALSIGVAIMGLLGLTAYAKEGIPERYPAVVRTMLTKGGKDAIIEGWRASQCMLEYEQPASAYKPDCIDTKRRPLVFLWGDSHAGSLYPGFKALQDSGKYQFGIGERTGAMCPSILNFEMRPLCKSLNDSNIAAIRAAKPDIVILYSFWHHPSYDLTNLEMSVQALKDAGVKRIILLGGVPYWRGELPQILLERWKKGNPTQKPPLRLGQEALDPRQDEVAAQMKARADKMGIEFIDPRPFFCNKDGCLTRVTDNAMQPLSYDYGHLSTGAAQYYVEQLAPLIFKK